MKYITHHRFKGIGACGDKFNIPRGKTFEVIAGFIATPEGRAICTTKSENAHKYFAIDDDGMGIERGELTYAIAYSPRKRIDSEGHCFRLSEEEQLTLRKDWSHFLRPYDDVILFNDDFFNADVEELRKVAKAINIKV